MAMSLDGIMFYNFNKIYQPMFIRSLRVRHLFCSSLGNIVVIQMHYSSHRQQNMIVNMVWEFSEWILLL